jgi:aconitate hydratase
VVLEYVAGIVEAAPILAKMVMKGDEKVTIHGLGESLKPRQTLHAEVKRANGETLSVPLLCRIDTLDELEYFRNDGILPYLLRQLAA